MELIQELKARLLNENDSSEKQNILDMISFWQKKLDIEPIGVSHLLQK